MTQEVEKRLLQIEVTQKEAAKIMGQLAESQKANDRAIDRLLVQFKNHFAVEEQHEIQLKEYRDKHEETLHELSGAVKQLSTQLASMPGLHDTKTRNLLTPLYEISRTLEHRLSAHELDAKTAMAKIEEKMRQERDSISRINFYKKAAFVSVIMTICGYLYIDLKHDINLNTEHILDVIQKHDSR